MYIRTTSDKIIVSDLISDCNPNPTFHDLFFGGLKRMLSFDGYCNRRCFLGMLQGMLDFDGFYSEAMLFSTRRFFVECLREPWILIVVSEATLSWSA